MNLTDGLFSDTELAEIMGPKAQLSAMLAVEASLAQVQARMGLIPLDAANAIADTANSLTPAPFDLLAATAKAGIAAQALVGALKSACGDNGQWAHFGATSQDIQDTGLVLQLRDALVILESRLMALEITLGQKAHEFSDAAIPARTRFQIAAPTTLGAKIAVWRAPLRRGLERLEQLRPRLLNVSFYGAAGTGAALAPKMPDVRAGVAADLDLGSPMVPWHAARDGIVELGGWLALLTGSLGKIGTDLILLGQSEISEVSAGSGGGSSTMPQKSNPVMAEALVTLARLNAGAVGTLHQAMVHAQERDGSALAIEWQILPDMVIRTGAALRLAQNLAETLKPKAMNIDASFAQDKGAMLAEAAGFYLTRFMSREEALKIVASALKNMNDGRVKNLSSALEELAPDHDWPRILAPENNLGDAVRQAKS
ncbi:3-carboxy-cis,cis-muconate cycloisomerase [Paracoccus sp. 11-3]|uniref:3-carboxy-cis,cis-muconate cycloisomerase n=1 Tax=Paracoccus amoyensis TaxID=2760093 RepID=A0A926GCD6_9RHOB|nr:lyase family protein [Paracoccus amoyensis]MBC9245851.1 3-carboxy-cis,cis-muconate cycloisomerase [Paracoccus amoyensis]